jgi:hypothetical protein
MLGAQEILIISAIVVGAIVIPRAMNHKKPAPRPMLPGKRLSGIQRMAVAASIMFPLTVAAIMQPWRKDPLAYLYIGLGPVVAAWLSYWVARGFRRR